MNIKTLREAKGLYQYELSRLTGISIETISRHENLLANPSLPSLKKYAQALDCQISDIVETQQCGYCGQEFYYARHGYKDTICAPCRKTMKPEKADATGRMFTEAELHAYQIGKRRLERQGKSMEYIIRETAREHGRTKEFVRGKMDGRKAQLDQGRN